MCTHTIPCRGAFGRPGECTITVHGKEAVLTVPPGENARFDGRQLAELIESLLAARDELVGTHRSHP